MSQSPFTDRGGINTFGSYRMVSTSPESGVAIVIQETVLTVRVSRASRLSAACRRGRRRRRARPCMALDRDWTRLCS